MAQLIKTDGTIQEITEPLNLESMQRLVGGLIQIVTGTDDVGYILNEEGKLMGLPANVIATRQAEAKKAIFENDVIVGDVIRLTSEEGREL